MGRAAGVESDVGTKPFDLKKLPDIMPATDQPMARLVVLSEGFAGLSHELKGERIAIGRIEDNTFQIAEPSVSSHHCEITFRGQDVVVKDLNSTNGTFIDGNPVTEGVLKPGQVLRLGQVELRIETGAGGPAPAPAAAKKPLDKTIVLAQGVKASEFATAHTTSVGAAGGFKAKTNKANRIFIAVGVALAVVIVVLLILVFQKMG